MKLAEIKAEVQKYQYFEDTSLIDISLAAMVATRLKLGDPIWLILIGPSSSGKSQVLRPMAITDSGFMHRVDDLTENTFLSGAAGGDKSLLTRIGSLGMIVISDFTVIFSKQSESRSTILSQFRMIYDGEMTKYSGNKDQAITWKGYLGVLAGSTPSIYRHFEEVADMGERFIYYRMKPYDEDNAMRTAFRRKLFGHELDEKLASMYAEFVEGVVKSHIETGAEIEIGVQVEERILRVSKLAERLRTPQETDWRGDPTRVPVTALPMRIGLQLRTMAKALTIMRKYEGEGLKEEDIQILEWCGYSLANEEKRNVLKIISSVEFERHLNTVTISDQLGLSDTVTKVILQNLASVGVINKNGERGGLRWGFKNEEDYNFIRSLHQITDVSREIIDRDATSEEESEASIGADAELEYLASKNDKLL